MGPNLWKVATWATLLLAICGQVPAIAIPEDSKTLSDVAESKEVMSIAPLNVPTEIVNTNNADKADPVVYVALPMKIPGDRTVQEASGQDIAANPLKAQNDSSSTDAVPFTDYAYFASTSASYLRSPGYPDDYPHNIYNRYVIVADLGMTVQIRVDHFDLEFGSSSCPYDYLEINDSNGYGSGRLCGTSAERYEYRSSGQVLNILFRTDGSVTRTGFSIFYQAKPATDCGNLAIDAGRGSLQSPGWPGNYPNDAFCTYTITAQEGMLIRMNVEQLYLEGSSTCGYDYLELREPGGRSSGRLCGHSTQGWEFVSSGNVTNVIFRTDGSVTYQGYTLSYEAIPDCGNPAIWAGRGTLQSPGYPGSYPNNADCSYNITADIGMHINITIDWYDLEGHSTCAFDYLEVSDPSGSSSGRLCGQNGTSGHNQTAYTAYTFISSGNVANVVFHSDGSITRQGYSLRYQAIPGELQILQQAGWSLSNNGVLYKEFIFNDFEQISFSIHDPSG